MPDQFAPMWKKAKEDFGGKKPSEKTLFFIRKSSGVGKAAVGLDKALANIDVANLTPLKTAKEAFEKAKTSYMKTLDTAMKEKGATDESKRKCQNLAATLSKMADTFEQSSVNRKTDALNVAIVKLVTKKGVPEDEVMKACWIMFPKNETYAQKNFIFSIMHKFARGAKEAKKLAEKIKTLVLPEIKKYCEIFGTETFENLPCDQKLKGKKSRLAYLHEFYHRVDEGNLETIIAATQVNATIWHKKGIDDFNAYRQTLNDLMNNDKLSRAIQSGEKPIGDSFKQVNKALDVYIDGLHPQLQTVKEHAMQIGVDYKPIDTLVEDLNTHKPFVRGTPGEDVRKWLSGISTGMSDAIQPLKKFKFPS